MRETLQRLRWLGASLKPRISGFDPMPFDVRFVVNKVTVAQVFLLILGCSSVIIIPPALQSISFFSRQHYVIFKQRR
jgi:hypothetical protein